MHNGFPFQYWYSLIGNDTNLESAKKEALPSVWAITPTPAVFLH